MKPVALLAITLLLGGCASLPEGLRTAPEQKLLPFAAVTTTAPEGQSVRWGGEVVRVSNLNEGSMIEVVQFSLNASGRPLRTDQSGGRFRIRVPGFIDPAIYTPGRLVTAVGQFQALEQDQVGEQPYTFPVLEARHVHLWPVVEKAPERCDCDPFFNTRFIMHPVILVPRQRN